MDFSGFALATLTVLLGVAFTNAETSSNQPVVVRGFTPIAFQAPSVVDTVSTYHVLTRTAGSPGQPFLEAYRRGYWGQYGISPTTSYNRGQAFYAPIQIGNETFKFNFDTGSSDLYIQLTGAQCHNASSGAILPSSECNLGETWTPTPDFEPIPDQNFNIAYGAVQVIQGIFGYINVTMAGICVRQQIAVANLAAFGGDGVVAGKVGFAYPSITFAFSGTNYSADNSSLNQVPYNPLFTTMYTEKKIPPVFSVALSRAGPYTPDGYVALGGLAPVNTYGHWARSPIQYVAFNSPGGGYLPTVLPYPQYQWYTITPDAFLFEGSQHLQCEPNPWSPLPQPSNSSKVQCILDSGSTQIYLPPSMSDAYNALIDPPAIYNNDLGTYSVPCNATAPPFAIQIGGVIFPVDERDLIMDDGTETGNCQSGVNNGDIYAPYVLGDVFMNNVMVVFDVGGGELRFRSRGYY